MLKPSAYILGELSQSTVFYNDTNNNSILDSEDKVIMTIKNATNDIKSFEKTAKELTGNTGSGTVYVDNSYYMGTKQVSIQKYNSNLFVSNVIDFSILGVLCFLAWFLLFPKKINK